MKNYNVYFEIYGKKMKVIILATDASSAKAEVLAKVKFHKIEVAPKNELNEVFDGVEDIFGKLGDIFKPKP